MEPVRRKFKSEISASSIDKLIEKRQRKRNFMTNKKPYSADYQQVALEAKSLGLKSGQDTVIKDIPYELLPKYKHLQRVQKPAQFEKPEHWVAPKKEAKFSRVDTLQMEQDSILKTVDRRATWSRAARAFIKARGQKVPTPSNKLTAKGYLSHRIDNGHHEQPNK